jgi:hypothetical protein
MNNKFFFGFGFLIFLIFSVVLIESCKDTSVDCTIPCYYGACVNNACNCNTGFEGDSCTVRTVDRFIGDWDAYDSCQALNYSYTATISASSSVVNQILITNLGQYGTSFVVAGNVSGFDITIPNQVILGIEINGGGAIDTTIHQIKISYTVKDEFQNTDNCSGIWKLK